MVRLDPMSALVAPLDRACTAAEPSSSQQAQLELNVDARTATLFGVSISFARREFDLILFLAEHAGICFTRLQLRRSVWGHELSGERTVDVHVRRVRLKLAGHGPTIVTVYGFGYRLDDAERVRVIRIR
jgi:DNA-binding response OmpR family regulator